MQIDLHFYLTESEGRPPRLPSSLLEISSVMVISESEGEECLFTGVHNGPSLAMQNRMGGFFRGGLLTLSAQTSTLKKTSLGSRFGAFRRYKTKTQNHLDD